MRIGALVLLVFFLSLSSCKSTGGETVGSKDLQGGQSGGRGREDSRASGGGVVDEIRGLTETGILSSMLQAIEQVRSRDLGASEFGRVMTGVNVTLIRKLYADTQAILPALDLPQAHTYTNILRQADQGLYVSPPENSTDYLEYVLPFLALFTDPYAERAPPDRSQLDRLEAALPDLQKAQEMRKDSVLAPFFSGYVHEKAGNFSQALVFYEQALAISNECYPAALAVARVMARSGKKQEAQVLLQDLVLRYPDSNAVKRQLAIAWYENGEWTRAEAAIAEILQRNSRDSEFILMRAHILVEQGLYMQAQTPLDLYSAINPNNRLYLFLRARIQAEGYKNREAALNYLRSILRSNPNDDEVSVYTSQLLMASPRVEDQTEGRELYRRLLGASNPSLAVLGLGLQDAIGRENWREAQGYLSRLLDQRRSANDLYNAYIVERGLGNNARALSYAKELYERDSANELGVTAYISALIDTGRQDEASKMIESRLPSASAGIQKSRYYFLRSRIRTGEDSALNDLRSSLFEDPRNLNALIAMFEIYHRRKDERRAAYYLKQALAIAPDNPQIKRYEAEYAGLLSGNL